MGHGQELPQQVGGESWAGITMRIRRVFPDLKEQRDMMVCVDCPMKTKSLYTPLHTLKNEKHDLDTEGITRLCL